jgi:hypothetical protein
MIFLPIAGRELRVAARKRSTFSVRVSAALVALIIGTGFFAVSTFSWGSGAASSGYLLFSVFSWMSIAVALSSGLFFTSDCLSEEKREGTLGFLFLTELRGYDVVAGKLFATSLRAAYGLLAAFPIIAVTLLMGGVTGGQFMRVSLALVNAMFVSLAAALFISAISRDAQKALMGAGALLVLLVGAGPACDSALAANSGSVFVANLSVSSPGYLFIIAQRAGGVPFWTALLVNQVEGWIFFGVASFLLPRIWQEKRTDLMAHGNRSRRWKFGGSERQRALRRKLLDTNPVLWLACRERWQMVLLWLASVLMLVRLAGMFGMDRESLYWKLSGLGGLFSLIFYLGIASQSGRFFLEARRAGLMELILVTPLTGREIIQGHWRALVRMFATPLVVCLLAQAGGTFMIQESLSRSYSPPAPMPVRPTIAGNSRGATNSTSIGTNVVSSNSATSTPAPGSIPVLRQPSLLLPLIMSVSGLLIPLGSLFALSWFGMWMGLTSRNSSIATLKTILLVQVLPSMIIGIASALAVPLLLIPGLMRGNALGSMLSPIWFQLIALGSGTLLSLCKDLGFFLWSRRRLYSEFRERASSPVTARDSGRL